MFDISHQISLTGKGRQAEIRRGVCVCVCVGRHICTDLNARKSVQKQRMCVRRGMCVCAATTRSVPVDSGLFVALHCDPKQTACLNRGFFLARLIISMYGSK